jgi:methionine sulfoxide reductase heme-binding subunit
MPTAMRLRVYKGAALLILLLPLVELLRAGALDRLGANPVERITHTTGLWALRLLLLTLAVTPLRRLSGWSSPGQFRRLLGLLAFFYAALHAITYFVFDHGLDWREIARDVVKHPYVALGFSAFVLLVPLACTSTDRMLRRLGGRRWKQIHRLVYPAAFLVVWHFFWLVKADHRAPLTYGVILVLLLTLRYRKGLKDHAQRRRPLAG